MGVAGAVFGVAVSGEAPPETGGTGPGAGWWPQSWQTACREIGISWVTMKKSPIFHLRCDLCLLSFPIFLLCSHLLAPGSIFLRSDNSVFLTPFIGKL